MQARSALGLLIGLTACATLLIACGDDAGGSGVVGTWEMDMSELKRAARESMEKGIEGAEGPMADMMRERMDQMLAGMDKASMTVTFAADGNWTGASVGPDESTGEIEKSTTRGTWSREGDKVMIVTTHEDGKVVAEPDTLEGILDGNVIRVEGQGADPRLVLRRK